MTVPTLTGTLGALDLATMIRTALEGRSISREDAVRLLQASDDEVLPIVAAAGQVRRHFFGRRITLNYLVNLKSGMCPEDCSYCSQSLVSNAEILRYSWMSSEQIADAVAAGVSRGASTVCLVASGRGPSRRELEHVAGVVADIHRAHPGVRICTCLGFIDEEKAAQLKDAGSDGTTTTSTPPSPTTPASARPTRTPTAPAPSPPPVRAGSPPAPGSSPGWARATSSSSTWPSACGSWASTRCRSISCCRSRGRRWPRTVS